MNFEHSQFLRALKNVEGWGSARFGERAIICNPYGASPLSPQPAIALLLSLRDGGVLVKKSVYI